MQSDYGKSLLDQKYKEFNYKIPEYTKIELTEKSGNDKIINDSKDLSLIKPGDVIILNGEYRLVAGYNKKIKKGFKHRYDIIGLEDVRNLDLSKSEFSLAIANSKGRNLRGQTHNITLTDGKKVDLFDLDISKLSYYLEDVSLTNKKNLKFADDKNVNDNLVNIYKELAEDIEGFEIPAHGYLQSWAEQGVLLLNTVLTVEEGKAHSHKHLGWEQFTDKVIAKLNEQGEKIIFKYCFNYR